MRNRGVPLPSHDDWNHGVTGNSGPVIDSDNASEFLAQADVTDDERSAIAHRNAEKMMRI